MIAITEENESVNSADFCKPVYEPSTDLVSRQRLVLTTWMLLDELKQCQEQIEHVLKYIDETGMGQERLFGVAYNPLIGHLENAHFNVSHILRLLWRSGLWTNAPVVERRDATGNTFQVMEEPFTDGKPNGRRLPENAPSAQKELLGVPVNRPETEELPVRATDTLLYFRRQSPSNRKAA